MRKALLTILLAVGLTVGLAPPPADAHNMQPYTWHRNYANCVNDSTFGNYGYYGFAQIDLVGTNCSVYTGVGIIAYENGRTHVKWCNVLDTIWNNTPGCGYNLYTATLTATAPGLAVSYATNACYDRQSDNFPVCSRQDHGLYMGPYYHTPPQF